MELLDAAHHDAQPRAGTAVAVMLAQVQDQVAARHLAVERRVVVKAVIPIHLESEKALIELVGLGDIEDAQDRHDAGELNGHWEAPVRCPIRPNASDSRQAPSRRSRSASSPRSRVQG
jgi:hypothetical protein